MSHLLHRAHYGQGIRISCLGADVKRELRSVLRPFAGPDVTEELLRWRCAAFVRVAWILDCSGGGPRRVREALDGVVCRCSAEPKGVLSTSAVAMEVEAMRRDVVGEG